LMSAPRVNPGTRNKLRAGNLAAHERAIEG
jgi:hypothetical protein